MAVDGMLDEAAWQKAQSINQFFQNFPFDTSFAVLQTEVKMTFDQNFLYVGAVIYQKQEDYIIASLKRDFSFGESDAFAVDIDPFKDKINGFHFAVSPLNVQREGLIDNGSNIPLDWDNKWYSAVKNYPEYWVVEMAIPFKTLRYKQVSGENSWRINFTRRSTKQNEISSWIPVPRQFGADNLAFTGTLNWDSPPPKPGMNISLIPYAIVSTEKDFEFKFPAEYSGDIGADAKIAVTPSLNLDLTINPDFSQVEVDRQIANLSRFELFFPERRQFFLENEDLFGKFGFPSSRPFFSRRIGIARGTVSRENQEGQLVESRRSLSVPITAGARLSGKIDKNWRIGLLNMHTGKLDDLDIDPANYTVGVVQRKVFDRSFVGAIVVNKENFERNADGELVHDQNGYNRIVGLEYNLFSKDNKWESEIFYHRSISSGDDTDAQSAALFLGRFTRNFSLFFSSQYVGENYQADVGFVPRTGFWSTGQNINFNIFPGNPKIIQLGFRLENDLILNREDWHLTDRSNGIRAFIQFPGQSELGIRWRNEYTYLFFPFDPTNIGGLELPEGSEYTYNSVNAYFSSDLRKNLYYDVGVQFGEFFNGHLTQVEGSINYRWQPVGLLALSYVYNNINLPNPYKSTDFWLIGPRAELSFSRSLFFSAFLQYNTQADNVNVNMRLQWRFQPVSDVFLVYTENYFTEDFLPSPLPKNRALVLKVTYWLNL